MQTDLFGRELDEALARAIGWSRYEGDAIPKQHREPLGAGSGVQVVWLDEKGKRRVCSWCGSSIPSWHASIDALLCDVWPVLQARGWRGFVLVCGPDGCMGALQHVDDFVIEGPTVPTPALALARAFLRALQEVEA